MPGDHNELRFHSILFPDTRILIFGQLTPVARPIKSDLLYRLPLVHHSKHFQSLASHDWQAGIDRRVKSAAFYVQFLKVFTESRMFAVRDLNNSVKLAMAFLVNFEFFKLFPIRGNVAEIPVEPDNQRRFWKRRG